MKNKPLIEKEKVRFEKSNDGTHCNDAYRCFDKGDVESACKFYKFYHNNYDLFLKDHPESVKGKMYLWLNGHNFDNDDDRNNEFNCFLFDYTFDDVVK